MKNEISKAYHLKTKFYCALRYCFCLTTWYLLPLYIDNFLQAQQTSAEVYSNQTSNTYQVVHVNSLKMNEISSQVIRHFNKLYPNSEPTWKKQGKNFLATIVKDGKYIRALFSKDGYLLYHIITGKEWHLPTSVRNLIKSIYYDFSIASINEVNVKDQKFWTVNLQGNSELVIVRVTDEDIEELHRYLLSK